MKLDLYIWKNSGFRIWLADRLMTIASYLNPARPWKRSSPIDIRSEDALKECLFYLLVCFHPVHQGKISNLDSCKHPGCIRGRTAIGWNEPGSGYGIET